MNVGNSLIRSGSFTLQVQHQQLPPSVLVRPVTEGQHGFLQEVGGHDLVAIIVVKLSELAGDALLYGKPLSGRVAVQQEHLQEPAGRQVSLQISAGSCENELTGLHVNQRVLCHRDAPNWTSDQVLGEFSSSMETSHPES